MSDQKIRNMDQFAALSGISRPTVSKYFHDPSSVRPSTRARIEAALQRFDYTPNIYAMNQNRRATKTIGIVVPLLTDPFFAEIARNLEMMVIESGFRPILLGSHGEPSIEADNLEGLRALRPAGVLLAPLGRSSQHAAVQDFCADVPTVLFDNNMDGAGDAFFGHDTRQAMAVMCEHLCDGGEPPCFFEMEYPTNPNAYRRRRFFVEAMEALGHDVHLVQVSGTGWNFEEIGYREGRRLIQESALPTNTVLCSNDRLAIGFLAAAYELGLRVGTGSGTALRIAGHDDHPFSRYTSPALTTVAQNYTSIARRSVETLLGIISEDERPAERQSLLFPGTLIVRSSA